MTSTTDVEYRSPHRLALSTIVLGVVLAGIAVVLLGVGIALAVGRLYDGRVLPGVRVGGVAVGGLTRPAAAAKLSQSFASLSTGKIVLVTPGGTDTLTYRQIGRGPDVAAMTAEALAAGRQGNPFEQALETLRVAFGGSRVDVLAKVDATAITQAIHAAAQAGNVRARDASAIRTKTDFSIVPSKPGRGLDEKALDAAIESDLSNGSAPATIVLDASDVPVAPAITDADAAKAAAEARAMAVPITLALSGSTWSIPAAAVHDAIGFQAGSDGTYGPRVDPAAITTAVAKLAKAIDVPPTAPTILNDVSATVYLGGGVNGRQVDVAATSAHVLDYLAALERGGTPSAAQLVAKTVPAPLPAADAGKLVTNLSKIGAWAVNFVPGESNGWGANIRLPAQYLNGTVVAPGEQFSFWNGVGPITAARGFAMGGVIINGHSDFTGALGGGICSASTTLFNAALRAGLEIDERHNHAYYIDRYPAGLDATVFQDGNQVVDMKFTNDTANALVIRGYSTPTSVTFEIWGVSDGRTVHIAQGPQTGYTAATTKTVTVSSLPAGTSKWVEYPVDGFNIWAYRTVTSASGQVMHSDSWYSHYITVTGELDVGAP